jgi:perosamine synthetase
MLNELIPYALKLRRRFPGAYALLIKLARRYFGDSLGIYPRPMANEVGAVANVLRGSQWNMTSGRALTHEDLEAAFAEYVGTPHAVAVNTGGMALQISMRALGLKPGDEVIHQVDTCSATAQAVIAAGCTPIFADISERSFMLDAQDVEGRISPNSRALVATHIWGNPEDMTTMIDLAERRGLLVIEDACLALGAKVGGRMAGSSGRVGVFSFGAAKPIQAGEGGMIVTADEALARELRAMRHWGDRTIEFGVRDTVTPSWNGRMSEIIAAVVLEQLKGYPRHLSRLHAAVAEFEAFLSKIEGLDLVLGTSQKVEDCAFTQVVVRLHRSALPCSKNALKDGLYAAGVSVWHANFEPISSLSLFRGSEWENWLPKADLTRTRSNYASTFSVAERVYDHLGLGLAKMNFLSQENLRYLMKQIDSLCTRKSL